jgi:hypothetical protein
MTTFLTDPANVYALIAFASVASIGYVFTALMWQMERAESDKQAEAASHFAEGAQRLNAALADSKATIDRLTAKLAAAYIRNEYGQMQRFVDWEKNGPKKPRTKAQKIREMGDHFLAETENLKPK